MPKERQVSFAGGELSPSLWGRTDLNRYLVGARTIRNFVVTPHGVLKNRSGTQHITRLLSTATDAVAVPFVYSESDTLLIVAYVRSDNSRTEVMIVSGNGSAEDPWVIEGYAELSSSQLNLDTLRFSQLGNHIVTVGEGFDPILWRRDPDTNSFSFESLSFDVPEYPSWLSAPRLEVRSADTEEATEGLLIDQENYDNAIGYPLYPLAGDSAHPRREWKWQVTRIIEDNETGEVWESAPATITDGYAVKIYWTGAGDVLHPSTLVFERDPTVYGFSVAATVAIYPDWTTRIDLTQGEGDDSWDTSPVGEAANEAYTLRSTRIYRGRDGVYGFVGETRGSFFVDDGAVPDFSTPPPLEHNPFRTRRVGDTYTLEQPRIVTYYENRRFFANLQHASTNGRPSIILGSALDDFRNFDEVIPADAADALEFTLASSKQETIRELVPMQRLVVLTDSAEWLVGGSGLSEVITPNSIAARIASRYGCAEYPTPVVVGDTVFFPQVKGVRPRALRLSGEGVESQDVSILSRHLFDGYTIKSWAYAEDPHQILWVARSDGALLSFTYVPEQEMMAWARHDIGGGGEVISLATLPEGVEDGVYMLVSRTAGISLERLAYHNVIDILDGVYLDRSSVYDGRQDLTSDPYDDIIIINTKEDLTFSDGTMGSEMGLFYGGGTEIPGLVGQRIRFTDEGVDYFLSVDSYSGLGAGWHVCTVQEPTDIPVTRSYQTSATDGATLISSIAILRNSAHGLGHLEGQEVSVFADGDVLTEKTVEAGAVYLGNAIEEIDRWAAVIYAGLPITAQFESLDAVQERGRQKVVKRATLELERSRGGHVGPDLDTLEEIRNRKISDAYDPVALLREEVKVPVPSQWKETGRVALQHTDPLPMTILGITREMEYGGD